MNNPKPINGEEEFGDVKMKEVEVLGMLLDEWKYKSCEAHFGVGDDWATLYDIVSKKQRCGHAMILLSKAKRYYESQGKTVGGTMALTDGMKRLYKILNIPEV